MTLEQALEILNKYDGTEMTDEQYYNYHCAQNKITRLILSGEYELVKKEAAVQICGKAVRNEQRFNQP